MTVFLNGKEMCSRQALHDHLKQQLNLPDYYGRNLDALWDLLTTTAAEVKLVAVAGMLNALGAYGCRLLKTFYDAAAENSRFEFSVED